MMSFSQNPTSNYAEIFAVCGALAERADQFMDRTGYSLSDLSTDGAVGFMAECGRIAHEFTAWADEHIAFDQWGEVWPYYIADRFGQAVERVVQLDHLHEVKGDEVYRRIAQIMECPLKDSTPK